MKVELRCTPNIAEDPLEDGVVRLPRVMHEQTDLLDGVGNIRSGECKVLESASDTTIESDVRKGFAGRRKLGTRLSRCASGVTVDHTGFAEQLNSVLTLRKEETRRGSGDSNTEEVMKRAKICHAELSA
mgnify:CR=1 FL=1